MFEKHELARLPTSKKRISLKFSLSYPLMLSTPITEKKIRRVIMMQ